MSSDGPPLLRPIPRRPFDINLTNATVPDDDGPSPQPSPRPDLAAVPSALLAPRLQQLQQEQQQQAADGASISRAQSVMNLTASTLFGIYSPTGAWGRDRFDRDDPDTPWGVGAQTPVRQPETDEPTWGLTKEGGEHQHQHRLVRRRRLSQRPGSGLDLLRDHHQPRSRSAVASSLLVRAALLFGLGMGYGVLVARLHGEQNLAAFGVEGIIRPDLDWTYLAAWGAGGVALGALLPWFDGVWEETFGSGQKEEEEEEDEIVLSNSEVPGAGEKPASPTTDWALVIRGIGAFVGIIFAIRKLPWTSTMQVSVTLALVNPFLWYLIDRSKPGFLLSAAVGLAGSTVLLGLKPDVMPAPTSWASSVAPALNNSSSRHFDDPVLLGGLASQETVETGIWMLSVLFCSTVCFGNIGRRLALNRTAATRGRWGWMR